MGYTIHTEPDPPALHVVYKDGRRVAQFESREQAERFAARGTGINVCVTNDLARAIGTIARRHLDDSIQVEWRETSDEREWFVTASDGVTDTVYVVDDESGTHMPLQGDELARYAAGQTVLVGDPAFKAGDDDSL